MEVDWGTVIWVAVILYTLAQWLFRRQRGGGPIVDEDATSKAEPTRHPGLQEHVLVPPPLPPPTFEPSASTTMPEAVDPLEGLYPELAPAEWLKEAPPLEAPPIPPPAAPPALESAAPVELPPELELKKPLGQLVRQLPRRRPAIAFRSRKELRRAIVASEVLAPPLALRR